MKTRDMVDVMRVKGDAEGRRHMAADLVAIGMLAEPPTRRGMEPGRRKTPASPCPKDVIALGICFPIRLAHSRQASLGDATRCSASR